MERAFGLAGLPNGRGSKPMVPILVGEFTTHFRFPVLVPFWGRCTTHFRTYFSGWIG